MLSRRRSSAVFMCPAPLPRNACRAAKARAEEVSDAEALRDAWADAELPDDREALVAYIDERVRPLLLFSINVGSLQRGVFVLRPEERCGGACFPQWKLVRW